MWRLFTDLRSGQAHGLTVYSLVYSRRANPDEYWTIIAIEGTLLLILICSFVMQVVLDL
jgi:hypothetical protein